MADDNEQIEAQAGLIATPRIVDYKNVTGRDLNEVTTAVREYIQNGEGWQPLEGCKALVTTQVPPATMVQFYFLQTLVRYE